MGRLLKRLIVLGVIAFVTYRALATLGIVGSDDTEWSCPSTLIVNVFFIIS